jgi:hypothetical protein
LNNQGVPIKIINGLFEGDRFRPYLPAIDANATDTRGRCGGEGAAEDFGGRGLALSARPFDAFYRVWPNSPPPNNSMQALARQRRRGAGRAVGRVRRAGADAARAHRRQLPLVRLLLLLLLCVCCCLCS